jgi:hypothetical protein
MWQLPDSILREVRRFTKLPLKIKRHDRQGED